MPTRKRAKKAGNKRPVVRGPNFDEVLPPDADDFQPFAPKDEEPLPVGGADEHSGLPQGWTDVDTSTEDAPVETLDEPPSLESPNEASDVLEEARHTQETTSEDELDDEPEAKPELEKVLEALDYDHLIETLSQLRDGLAFLLNKAKTVSPKSRQIIKLRDLRAEAEIATLNERKK